MVWAVAILVWGCHNFGYFFLVVITLGENFIIHFNGKNYASWEFQFRMFVKGKELWGHLDGSSLAPTDPKELSLWEGRDAKIASWLLSSVEPHMVNNIRGFTTVKTMWDYLRRIYYQDNSARKFQLELDIRNYSRGTSRLNNSIPVFLIYGVIILGW